MNKKNREISSVFFALNFLILAQIYQNNTKLLFCMSKVMKDQPNIINELKRSKCICHEIEASPETLKQIKARFRDQYRATPMLLKHMQVVLVFNDPSITSQESMDEFKKDIENLQADLHKIGVMLIGCKGLIPPVAGSLNLKIIKDIDDQHANSSRNLAMEESNVPNAKVEIEEPKPNTTRKLRIINRSIRTGESIIEEDQTDILINGDIKAGSEVATSGSIICTGKIAGVAHAGVGCGNAVISAQILDSEIVSIYGVFVPNADIPKEVLKQPVCVVLNEDNDKIEFINGKVN
ncbi:TPA: hypothetical protein I7730_14515 [Vibrio vulnificus]|uniref:Probable septum site-determining protein MinC n=1 Tax=Vibrio vulnificus TaxID=672 RepID=A0A8H9TFU1_VIBVL|nr:hypothetical protein [Vibrio vulnificus]HAS8541001.1 hypothetical protein [Vibrio vulnificus]